MPSSCRDIRDALAACLQASDCVMVQRNSAGDCLRPPLLETLPTQCQQLKRGYGECKRGLVDMRKRFRGNQPIAVSRELEGGSNTSLVPDAHGEAMNGSTKQQGYQLYGGKPAFQDTVRRSDGNDDVGVRDWRELENEKYRKELAEREAAESSKKR